MIRTIGIDLGGSKIRAGVIDEEGRLSEQSVIFTKADRGREAVETRIRTLIEDLENQKTKVIGLAVPGVVRVKEEVIVNCPNLLGWKNIPFKELESLTNLPLIIENDAKCALYAEADLGSAKGVKSVVLLTLGTGIGGAILEDGQILHEEKNITDEIGHTVIDPTGPVCNCGQKGCIESFWRQRENQNHYIARGIAIINQKYQPELFLLGGGLAQNNIASVQEELKKLGLNIKVELTKFGDWSGVIGSGKMALDKLYVRS